MAFNSTTMRLLLLAALLAGTAAQKDACTSPVYCEGALLQTVQLANVFPDSKTFVDRKQRQPQADTLRMFDDMMTSEGGQPSRDRVARFVEEAFEAGSELQDWTLPDFTPSPAVLNRIQDPAYRSWASDLNHLWKNLSRKMTEDVQLNQEQYSILYVPNGFVVPGGRFLEFYYWDTYWIMQGILQCELYETARGVLENFLAMVEEYGFVPNGGRVYYLNRSQPPLLTPMVRSYVRASGDLGFFERVAPTLEKEYDFWTNHRTVMVEKGGKSYRLARYFVESAMPRPESYSEDYRLAQLLPAEQRDRFYQDIRSGAESGWDFSSRWFIDDQATNTGNLSTISTQSIVPVDLNAFLYWNAQILSEMFALVGKPDKALYYEIEANAWLEAVTAVLWHEDLGSWLDYDIVNNKRREYFFPTNLAPLWTGCYDKSNSAQIADQAVSYLQRSGALSYAGGLPTSLGQTGEQWDLPNAWPPLQHMVIMGLDLTGDLRAQELAFDLADRWVHANYLGFLDSGEMYEKYDAETPGGYGGGGEYVVQAGFGWTNGVILDLLAKYGGRLRATRDPPAKVTFLDLLTAHGNKLWPKPVLTNNAPYPSAVRN